MAAIPEYANGEVIANKYVVEGLLGDSPSSRTFLANAGLGTHKLCIKIFRTEVSARLLSAPDFFLKAGVAAEIEHDNLAACIDIQEEMGHVFSARLHVEGMDFEEWVRRNRGEGNYFTRGLELLWQACQGLAALHERTRHLNIHPGNMLVTPLMAKLADWDPRSLGSMEMTPDPLPFRPQYAGYRAPEMGIRGSFLSYPSTDLFAVAGLLYRLVSGNHPESGPDRIQAGIRALDKDLGAFLSKAMHARPEERFQEASSFSDALWDLQGSMQRLQETQSKAAPVRPRPSSPLVPPQARKVEQAPLPPEQRVPPTLAMTSGPDATLLGSEPGTARDESPFDFFPAPDAPRSAPPSRKQPPSEETFFGSSLEAPAGTGGTHFGAGEAAASETFFGSEPEPPARRMAAPRRESVRSDARPPREARPPAISLSSLEKDPLDAGGDQGPGGFTEFGFKGAGDRTRYPDDGGKAPTQRKLVLALGAVGALILVLALGGLFVFLRGSAAPEPSSPAESASGESDPAQSATYPNSAEPGAAPPGSRPASEGPPYAVEPSASETPPAAEPPPGSTPPEPAQPAISSPRPASAALKAAKGTPERLAELMKMVETRAWPDSPSERLKAADELNDFGKVAEANMVYGRALVAPGISGKQKISALGGLAVTFYSMGMKEQASDAVNQILAINPQNAFALKFREKLR